MIRDDVNGTVSSEIGPWAMVPAWVLLVKDENGKGLSGAELRVYIALRTFADRGGEAFPLVRTIAKRADVTMGTAEKAIARLRGMGLLTSEQKRSPDGKVILRCEYRLRDVPPNPPSRQMEGTPPSVRREPLPPSGGSNNTPGEHPRENTPPSGATRSARSASTKKNDQKRARDPIKDAADRELFQEIVGDALITYNEDWSVQAEYTADAAYDHLRATTSVDWPGGFLRKLEDDNPNAVSNWLLTRKLERYA